MDEARSLLDEFARSGFHLPLDFLWLIGMVGWAEVAIACAGTTAYAGPLLDRLAPWADHFPYIDVASEGPVSLYLGGLCAVLGRYGEADAYFAQSADFCERFGTSCFAAQTDLWWGRMLAERNSAGDADRARPLFASGRTPSRWITVTGASRAMPQKRCSTCNDSPPGRRGRSGRLD